jgi:hypothetical protein
MIRLVGPLLVLSLVIFVTAYALKPRLRAASFVALRHLCIALGGCRCRIAHHFNNLYGVDLNTKLIISAVVGVVLVVVLVSVWPMVSVPAGHRGVVTMFGDVHGKPLEPGLNFVNPMAHVRDMNVQVQKAVIKGDAASKDLQHVNTTLTVNFALDPAKVAELYSNVGQDYEAKLLDGTAQDAFKGVTAQFYGGRADCKREDVRARIRDALQAKVSHLSAGAIIGGRRFYNQFRLFGRIQRGH